MTENQIMEEYFGKPLWTKKISHRYHPWLEISSDAKVVRVSRMRSSDSESDSGSDPRSSDSESDSGSDPRSSDSGSSDSRSSDSRSSDSGSNSGPNRFRNSIYFNIEDGTQSSKEFYADSTFVHDLRNRRNRRNRIKSFHKYKIRTLTRYITVTNLTTMESYDIRPTNRHSIILHIAKDDVIFILDVDSHMLSIYRKSDLIKTIDDTIYMLEYFTDDFFIICKRDSNRLNVTYYNINTLDQIFSISLPDDHSYYTLYDDLQSDVTMKYLFYRYDSKLGMCDIDQNKRITLERYKCYYVRGEYLALMRKDDTVEVYVTQTPLTKRISEIKIGVPSLLDIVTSAMIKNKTLKNLSAKNVPQDLIEQLESDTRLKLA